MRPEWLAQNGVLRGQATANRCVLISEYGTLVMDQKGAFSLSALAQQSLHGLLIDSEMDWNSIGDAELVDRARSGEDRALAALFERYGGLVRSMAHRLAGPQLADDVAQDALLEAMLALGRLESPGTFRAWLLGVTVRVARRRFRIYGSRLRCWQIEGQPAVEREAASTGAMPDVALELKDVGVSLAALPAHQQDAWRLRRIDGHKLDDVAQTLGISLATVKRWLADVDAQLVRA